jgi:hypothetical protein
MKKYQFFAINFCHLFSSPFLIVLLDAQRNAHEKNENRQKAGENNKIK